MPVYTFVRHHTGNKLEVRPEDNVADVMNGTDGLPEVTAERHRYRCERRHPIDHNGVIPRDKCSSIHDHFAQIYEEAKSRSLPVVWVS